jgi:hypothetical protein
MLLERGLRKDGWTSFDGILDENFVAFDFGKDDSDVVTSMRPAFKPRDLDARRMSDSENNLPVSPN